MVAQQTATALAPAAALPALPALVHARGIPPHQWNALKEMFRGASDAMILTAVDYCVAKGFDIMKKPVHIVPVWDAKAGRMIEGIWEGIGSIRTTAARTDNYAGQDEPVFGPEKTKEFVDNKSQKHSVTFPEWCKVTVYRIVKGARCPFVGLVYYEETMATVGKTRCPNEMWRKRPKGQSQKCAEADALRKAFPEALGSDPTAEEMEGRSVHDLEQIAANDPGPRPGKLDQLLAATELESRPAQPDAIDVEHEDVTSNGPSTEETELDDELDGKTHANGSTDLPTLIAVTANADGTPNWREWRNQVARILQTPRSADWLEAWEKLHNTTIVSFAEGAPKNATALRKLLGDLKEKARGQNG